MSRIVDVNFIAGQIIEAARGSKRVTREVLIELYRRLTFGLAEYEREQVAWLVNFRLAEAVL
ncbi:MAG: hypothetical protein HRF43_10640 [Phycisphaerae bacterium]|jgi:Na+-transporting NADH:ubiquinone oxidoreductase subunit NqrA